MDGQATPIQSSDRIDDLFTLTLVDGLLVQSGGKATVTYPHFCQLISIGLPWKASLPCPSGPASVFRMTESSMARNRDSRMFNGALAESPLARSLAMLLKSVGCGDLRRSFCGVPHTASSPRACSQQAVLMLALMPCASAMVASEAPGCWQWPTTSSLAAGCNSCGGCGVLRSTSCASSSCTPWLGRTT